MSERYRKARCEPACSQRSGYFDTAIESLPRWINSHWQHDSTLLIHHTTQCNVNVVLGLCSQCCTPTVGREQCPKRSTHVECVTAFQVHVRADHSRQVRSRSLPTHDRCVSMKSAHLVVALLRQAGCSRCARTRVRRRDDSVNGKLMSTGSEVNLRRLVHLNILCLCASVGNDASVQSAKLFPHYPVRIFWRDCKQLLTQGL